MTNTKYSGRCEHGNMPHECQQCQYERDVAIGYPEPWRLWEYLDLVDQIWLQATEPIPQDDFAGYLGGSGVRRRHDADEIIAAWEREQKRKLLQPDLENIPDIFQSDELFQCPYNNCRCDLKEPCRECEAFIEFVSDIQGKYKKIEDYFDNVSPEQLSKDIKSVMTQPAPCGPWISVEDRLPEAPSAYLTTNWCGVRRISFFNSGCFYDRSGLRLMHNDTPKYWWSQPLPPPPKGE